MAALLPLLIARRDRLAWAARLWAVACGSWLLSLGVARGWTGSFAPTLTVVLAPAAVAVAACVGLGVAAFESDLSGFRFGWRQLVTAAAMVLAVVGIFPVVVAAGGGRWNVPSDGFAQPLSYLSRGAGSYRVLWLGDPDALPLGGWSVDRGLAYATSEQGTPDAPVLWAPAGPGPADLVRRAVDLAEDGQTTHLGRLLAPAGIRYIVVVTSLAPSVSGGAPAAALPPPPGLLPSLSAQGDLQVVPGEEGFTVFTNTEYIPERAQRPASAGAAVTSAGPAAPGATGGAWPSPTDVAGWHPVLPGPPGARSYQGRLTTGTALALYAPAGSWHLSVDGRPVAARPAFGWAAQYRGDVRVGAALLRRQPVAAPRGSRRARPVGGGRGDPGRQTAPDRAGADPPGAAGCRHRSRTRPERCARGGAVSADDVTGPTGPAGDPGAAPGPSTAERARRRARVAARTDAAGARRRGLVLVLVGAVLVGGALLSRVGGAVASPATGSTAASLTPVAESTSWYCAGVTGQGGAPANGVVYLTNTTGSTVGGTVSVVSDAAATKSVTVALPAYSERALNPAGMVTGNWLATRVDLSAGGVVVTQGVSGPLGWSTAPCASTTATRWYFASGSTAASTSASTPGSTGGDRQWIALYNPTVSPAVVDLTFATPAGVSQPQPFAGIVVPPGQLTVEDIGTYVQDQREVSTIVAAQSGRVVADQLSALGAGGVQGLSLQLGALSPRTQWAIPRSVDTTGSGAATTLAIFNPTPDAQRTTVSFQLPSGPVTPVTEVVAPDSTWSLQTNALTRIPANVSFATTVTSEGPGVVVGRLTATTSGATAPQAGADGAVAVSGGDQARQWWLPGPGTAAFPTVSGAAPDSVTIANPWTRAVSVSIDYLGTTGLRPLGAGSAAVIPPGRFVVIPTAVLAPAGLAPLRVSASAKVAVTEDFDPAGSAGVVTFSGVPSS